jgi:hypothetical protein
MKKAPMKKIWNILFFAAINETQHIRLFEEGKDFELCVEDNNVYTGTYWISMDTVFLSYRNHMDLSTNILPSKLFINKGASNIKSTEGYSFSAEIYLDTRQKIYSSPPNNLRALSNFKEQISVVEALK